MLTVEQTVIPRGDQIIVDKPKYKTHITISFATTNKTETLYFIKDYYFHTCFIILFK